MNENEVASLAHDARARTSTNDETTRSTTTMMQTTTTTATTGLTRDEATKLASTLYRTCRLSTGGKLTIWARVDGDRIVFVGGLKGEHSLALSASNEARVRAHWAGYVENNGLEVAPAIGQRVEFSCASASRCGGWRTGVVLSVGPRRARIAFTYKNGRKGERVVPFSAMRF